MPANSVLRRCVKKILGRLDGTPFYTFVHAAGMAYDIRSHGWSEPELDLLPLAVAEGDRVLDIGANVGLWAYHLSRAVGARGHVLAFEPIPSTFATLLWVRRLLRLTNVDPIPLGCGERSGSAMFTVPLQESGAVSSGLAHLAGRGDVRDNARSSAIRCELVTLDEYLSSPREITFMKCDIEGAELFAMRGADRLIREYHPTVVCEITERFVSGFGVTVDELIRFFLRHGYRQYHYDRGRTPPLWELDPSTRGEITWHNYAFIHPLRLNRFAPMLGIEDQRGDGTSASARG